MTTDAFPFTKPVETEGLLNRRLFHPLARRLAIALVPTGISPNAVSISGVGVVVAAAGAYVLGPWPWSAVVGLFLHLCWHVVDGADGELARRTGRSSPMGEVVDGLCDYAGHIFLYCTLAWFMAPGIGTVAAMTLAGVAGVSRAVQSNHFESGKRAYLWRVYGVPWIRPSLEGGSEIRGVGGVLTRRYVAISRAVSPGEDRLDNLFDSIPAERIGDIRTLCAQAQRRMIARASWLGANPRTVALGLSMAAGSPIWFMLLEATAMNLLLIVSIALQGRANRRLAAMLEARA